MSTKKDPLQPPDGSEADGWHALAKGAISGVPFAGGALSEMFNLVVAPQFDKRRQRWMEAVHQKLKEHEEAIADFEIAKLSQNEQFITAVVRATRAALATHQEEKLDALQNAVLNVAVGRAPSDDMQQMFLNFVDDFTPWHLVILRMFQDPISYGEVHGITWPDFTGKELDSVIEHAFPELRGLKRFYEQVLRDLDSRGLMDISIPRVRMSQDELLTKRTTGMGDEFYGFITAPPK